MSSAIPLPSFTETVLLNKTFLNLICPVEKKTISQTNNSIFQTLNNLPLSSFNVNFKPTTTFERITKPVKVVARTTIITLATLTASPVGILLYGSATMSTLIFYIGHRLIKANTLENRATQDRLWVVITEFASASKRDLTAFLTGIVALSFLTVGTLFATVGCMIFPINPIIGALSVAYSTYYYYYASKCGGSDPSLFIARLVGDSDIKAGLYNALELRNKFGFVDQNGDLLKFSKADKIDCWSPLGSANIQILEKINIEAELELVDLVRDTNKILKANNFFEIAFKYPLNGKEIAEHLEKTTGSYTRSKLPKTIIQDLKNLSHKIDTLRELTKGSENIARHGSIFYIFADDLSHQPPVYCDNFTYRDRFFGTTSSSNNNSGSWGGSSHYYSSKASSGKKDEAGYKAPPFNLRSFYETVEVESVASNVAEPTDKFDAFAHRLGVGKWKISQGQTPMAPHQLIDLKLGFSEGELKKAYRQWGLILHPDKNKERETKANTLLQALNCINDKLKKDIRGT